MESEVECTKRLSQWKKMSGTESHEGTIPGESNFLFTVCLPPLFILLENGKNMCVIISWWFTSVTSGSWWFITENGDMYCEISGFESLITFNYIISYIISQSYHPMDFHGSYDIPLPPLPFSTAVRPWNSCWSSCKLPPRPKIPSCCWSSRAARTRPEPPSTAPVRCGVWCAPRGSRCHGWWSRRWMWISKPPGLDSVTKTIQQPWYCWEKSCTTKRMVETL